MNNFEEWELIYKVTIANPKNCNVPTVIIHEALDAAIYKLVVGNKVAIGQSSLEGNKL